MNELLYPENNNSINDIYLFPSRNLHSTASIYLRVRLVYPWFWPVEDSVQSDRLSNSFRHKWKHQVQIRGEQPMGYEIANSKFQASFICDICAKLKLKDDHRPYILFTGRVYNLRPVILEFIKLFRSCCD